MEDFLQIIVKCFPIASFILVASSCSNKAGEMKKTLPPGGCQLTRTATSSVSEVSEVSRSEEDVEIEEKPAENEKEERKVACGNKKPEQKDKSEDSPDVEKAKKKEESKAEQEIVLDEPNPHFAFLLNCDQKSDLVQMCNHSRLALEHCAAFQWTMKKRLAFDEGCWKHLGRRISAIKAEGFEVRVNTRKARENKANADRETKLDIAFQKISAGKPKKKAAE